MKKLNILITLILIVSFSSCKKETQKSVPNISETEEISLLDTLTLKFDNGEKWVANIETQIGVIKMDSIINTFKTDGNEDYASLGETLSEQTSFIIKSCNMTGEAHDQLHVVLVPMLDEISILKEATTAEDRKSALNELENLIEGYFSHFRIQ